MCLLVSSASGQVTHGPPRVRNVYIPADELKLLFDSSSKGVLMPRDKILALWQEGRRHSSSQALAPADTVLTEATYEAQLADHELRVTGRMRIAKLREGWQTLDLPFGGLAIESAQLDGQPARFGRKQDGTLFLLLEKEGRFELGLEMSAPLASKGGDLATTLKLPPAPASEIGIRLDKSKQLQVGETRLQPDGDENGRQRFRVAVDRSGLVPLVISERFAAGNRVPLVLVNSRSIGRIEPAGLRWEATLDLNVYARANDTFRLQLPDSLDLAAVDAPELSRWTIGEETKGTATVTLAFRKPFLGRRAVRLVGLAPVPSDAPWDVPTVKVLGAASHVGQVSIDPSPSLRVEVGSLAGIRPERLSAPSAPAAPATASTPYEFAFWDEDFRLPLRVTPRRGTMQASLATLVEVSRAGVTLRSSVTVEPRYAPIFDVQVQLPRDWEVTSVLSADKPVAWESAPTASAAPAADASRRTDRQSVLQTVRFDLAKPLSPGQSLKIALTAQRRLEHWLEQDEAFQELPLPDLRVVGADEVEGTLLLQAPPDIELLASGLSDDLQPVPAEGARSTSAPSPGTALQYRYQDDARVSGRLQVRTKPARVSAETLAFVRLDRGKLDVHEQLDLHIRQGRVRQIGFTLPAAVGEKLQIVPVDSAARVIEQRHSRPPNAGDGKGELYLWQIVLDRPVTGELALALDFGQTSTAAAPSGGGAAPTASAEAGTRVAVPVLALEDVSRQSGIVAVEAADDQQIDCQPESLRSLDPAEVLKPKAYAPKHRIVAAYQYQRLPYGLRISATHHASESVLAAICESAEITSVAERQGRMRHQARFWLRSLNAQHVPVVLPAGADLWSAMLDSKPVEVRRKEGAYIIPLPAAQAGSASATRELTLLYETDGPSPGASGFWDRLWPQTLRQGAPEIKMTTLGTTWQVHPPEGTELVSAGGDFQPETRLTRPTLAAALAETVARQSTSGLPWKFGGLVTAFIIAGFYWLIWSGKGCGTTLVEVLVVVAVIGVLIALLLPATQSAREAGRRAQCMNNLKQIGLALLNYEATYKQFPPAVIGPSNVPRERQFSWLVAILPYLEQQSLYSQLRLDLPNDHPHNAALLKMPFNMLVCPSDPSRTATQEGLPKTSYVAITGADFTRGPGGTRGVIGFDRGLSLAEIVDGTSNTIMVAEVTDGGPWFAGGSATARRIDDLIEKKTWSQHPGGGLVLFADGSVRFLSSSIDVETLRHLATAQGGESITEPDFEGRAPAGAAAAAKEAAPPAAKAGLAPPAKTEEAKAELAPPAKKEEGAKPPTPAPATPQEKPSPQPARQPAIPGGERARLSLGVALETYGGEPIRFRREGGAGELVLGLQDRTFAQTLQWAVIAAALLAAWIWRRLPGPRRAMAVVVGLAAPIGLSGLVPLPWTPLLDGLLLGALAAACLWIVLRIIASAKASVPRSAAAAMAIGFGLLLAAESIAAEAPAVTGASPASAGPASAAPASKVPASRAPARQPDLTLFIPYDPDRGKPLESTQVYLPHDEFLRLWKQAHPEKPSQAPPDVRAIVAHAEYSGRLENDVARFDGRLVIHHLVDGWTPVMLPLGKVGLERIEIDGRPAPLGGGDRDQPAIYVEKAGLHVVDVRFGVPVSRLGATGQMTVPLRPVSSGRLVFRLPPGAPEVQVSGASGGWRRQSPVSGGKGEAKSTGARRPSQTTGRGAADEQLGDSISIPLGAANELSIRWQPRRVEAREGQLASVDQALLVEVLDSGVHFHGRLHYRIQQGALRELRLRIPPEVAIESVRGADVADWSIETSSATGPDPAEQRLVVSLKAELTNATDVLIDALRRDRKVTGPIDIHALEPLGVVRETGGMGIGSATHFRVRIDKTERLEQIDRTGLDLPQKPSDGCALLSAYRYTSRPWRLQLQVERQPPRVEVSDRTAVAVTARHVLLRSLLTANVSGAPIASLGLRLPASLRVSQVRVPPGADWFLDRDAKGRQLKVRLKEPALGTLDLAVSGALVRDTGQAEFTVPGVAAEGVQSQRGQLAIYLDDDLEAVLANDGGARSIDPAALDRTLAPPGDRPANYAFQYDSPPKDLRLRLSSAPSRASADVTTVVSVREGGAAYISELDFEVREAGRSRFRVATPEWLGEDIELRGEQIRQIRCQLADHRRTWEIELQQPVRGAYRLHMVQTLPLADDGTVPAAVIRPLDVERSRSHIVLENATADEIAVTKTSGVAPVPIAAVPEGMAESMRRQAVAAYRVVDDAAALAWQRRVREQEAGLTASISLADLTTVLHADGRYRARAAYNIRNFTLQFLELELPPDSQVWSVHVSGQPVRPAKVYRQGRPIALLPLEKTSAGDFSSKVVVIYSGRLEEPLHRWSRVRPPAPQILSDVPVSRTLWTVLLPRQYEVSLVKGESNLEEVGAEYQQEERKLSFLDELRQVLQVASYKSMSAARIKAQSNLKQVGAALRDYAQESAQAGAKNAAEVQEQAQQIAAEIRRLEEVKSEAKRPEAEAAYYFRQRRREAEGARAGVDLERGFEKLPEPAIKEEGKAAPKDEEKARDRQVPGVPEERRGDLRKQAAEQLARLQTMPQEGPAQEGKTALQHPSKPPEGKPETETVGLRRAAEARTGERAPQDRQAAPGTPAVAAGAGRLSLDLDMALVGTAHHFSKLHGEPRLVLRTRHESLSRGLSAIVWAGLCLALATAVVQGLRRPDALARASRGWPWLAAGAGAAWLFLLPAGVLGLALLVIAFCVLARRSRKRQTAGPGE